MSNISPHKWMPLFPKLADDHVTRLFLALALFLIAGFVIYLPAWLLDPRMLDGAAVWTKPQKFNISLSLHFLTLALLAQLLPKTIRTGWPVRIFAYLSAIALVFEFVYVAIQAGRARRSHFNFETGFEALMYAMMGLAAFFLMAIALVMAIQIWRKADRTRKGLWLGSIIGLAVAFVTTVFLIPERQSDLFRHTPVLHKLGGNLFTSDTQQIMLGYRGIDIGVYL